MTVSAEDLALAAASGLFDADWYLRRNPQVGSREQAIEHYFASGTDQDPGPGFSARHYLMANPDVAAAGVNPLLHYLHHGESEGRARFPVDAPLPDALPTASDMARLDHEQALVSGSALFDAAYYLATNEDVRAGGVDPLRHFLEHGAREGRLPNPFFDTRYYQATHMAPDEAFNPLAHYLESPARDTLETSARFDGRYYLARHPDAVASGLAPLDHFLRTGLALGRRAMHPSPGEAPGAPPVDPGKVRCTVLVPVHDATEAVAECLDALFRHTRFGGQDSLLVIDDASREPGIAGLLAPLRGRPGVTVLRQDINLGYTRTVNRGLAMAGEDDVVLLNSDTVVGPHWLRRLKVTAAGHGRIGTVTAVSNAAGEFSVPSPGHQSPPEAIDADMVARAVEDAGATPFEVPTGNGFCLYVRRAMIAGVGDFDEAAFPEGYGEENDLCLRASAAGWSHLVDPSVYVRHRRSASFGQRREALASAGLEVIRARYPDYEGRICAISRSPGFVEARYRIDRQFRRLASGQYRPRPRILYVISTRNGGTPKTNADLMRAIAPHYDAFAVASDGNALELMRAGTNDYERLERIPLSEPLRFASHASLEYDQILRSLMIRLGIDLLHVRHLAWHGLGLVDVAHGLGIPVLMSFHDYYCICPTVNLLDEDGRFHPRGVAERAPNPLWHHDPTVQEMSAERLAHWQQRMQQALAHVSAFVTTSPAARRLVSEALPAVGARQEDFHVIPHGRDFDRMLPGPAAVATGPGRPLRVLLPGNLSAHKGAALVRAMKAADVENRLEFHLLGKCPPELEGWVVDHGTYARADFVSRVEAIAPDLAAVLSVWPETFCHTLTECWASGLPVVGVDIGAVGERIRGWGGGWLLDYPVTPESVHRLLLRLADDAIDRSARAGEVRRWQGGEGRESDTARMAARYREIYALQSARP